MNASEHVAEIVKALPKTPGVYRYFDKKGTIIYVGKAKNLKNRVSSYFLSNNLNRKTQILVSQICDIEYTVVDSESEALLLENVLIKQLQPKYNILLKDDKTYPWVCITNEEFPRILYTRQKNLDGEYFGPFASAYTIKTLLALIQQLYPVRTCKHNINEQGIKDGKFDICLDYHIGNCLGPCIGKIARDEYTSMFADIRKILRGDLQQVQAFLKKKMMTHAANLEFEEAAKIKHKLDLLENYQSKSTVVDTNISNVEAFGFAKDINSCYISYLRIQNGAIIASHSVEIRKRIEETDEDILAYAIIDIREELKSKVKTIILPFKIDFPIENVKFEYPQKGDKGKILELANRNAKFFMLEKHKQVALPLVNLTLATLRIAELGFLGVVVYTLVQTPLLCGQESNAGDLLLSAATYLPFLTNCCIVGINNLLIFNNFTLIILLQNLDCKGRTFFLTDNITFLFFLKYFLLTSKKLST